MVKSEWGLARWLGVIRRLHDRTHNLCMIPRASIKRERANSSIGPHVHRYLHTYLMHTVTVRKSFVSEWITREDFFFTGLPDFSGTFHLSKGTRFNSTVPSSSLWSEKMSPDPITLNHRQRNPGPRVSWRWPRTLRKLEIIQDGSQDMGGFKKLQIQGYGPWTCGITLLDGSMVGQVSVVYQMIFVNTKVSNAGRSSVTNVFCHLICLSIPPSFPPTSSLTYPVPAAYQFSSHRFSMHWVSQVDTFCILVELVTVHFFLNMCSSLADKKC